MMKNFEYCTPTKLIFGEGVIEKLPETLKPYGKKVLLAYGGGSIKKIGLYDKVLSLLQDFEIVELTGIEPNPKYSTSVLDGVALCKKHQIDVILAVGGGSVLDCCKAIAAGAKYDGEPWDLITYQAPTLAALPIVDVMTLAATGSEYDAGGVISRMETNDKVGYGHPLLFPKASLLDPTYTFTVSQYQTAAGISDAINHVIEQFFTTPTTYLTDHLCLALIGSLIKLAPTVLANPKDYAARAEMMVDCSLACNGILSIGNGSSGWPCHAIEHALSAYYDITHGIGLAIITPRWMKHILSEKTVERFVVFGTNLFGIDAKLEPMVIAQKTIDALYDFYVSMNIPMHLKEVGIDASCLEEMAKHIADTEGLHEAYAPLQYEDILSILKASL